MADNTRGGSQDAGNPLIATDEVTYSGETADVQLVRIVETTGSEGSKTVVALTTGVQYVEDTSIAANAGQGTLVTARRDDALSTLTPVENDAVGIRVNSRGAVWAELDPFGAGISNLVHEAAQYTTTQTSAVLVAGGASEKLVVTSCQIQSFDTASGDCIVYFGTGAYSRGTNRAIFDGTFKPSSTSAPGAIIQGPFPSGTNGDDILVTTTNNVDVTISVWYYVIT